MASDTNPKILSATAQAVQLVQDMVQCGMTGARYEDEVSTLHALMSEFAMQECRANGMRPELTLEWVTHEDNENTPEAEAYWRQTSVFFRKVFQAAAAAA